MTTPAAPAGAVHDQAWRGAGPLMLVSADVGPELRTAVAAGDRPCPEYLLLEQDFGVRLLDWTAMSGRPHHRSGPLSVRHAARALPLSRSASVVFSDGEHVGLPLAVAAGALRMQTPHVMIGHRLLEPAKARMFRMSLAGLHIRRILVHSARQAELVPAAIGVDPSAVHHVPYGVDTAFWAPPHLPEDEELVFAAGREHRDYRALASACTDLPVRVVITDQSTHSPGARRQAAERLPANMSQESLTFRELRETYARAAIVAVPILATDFPAGITATLEAMAMGKAVVASATDDLSEIIEHGRTGLLVPPGNVRALRQSIAALLADSSTRRRLGDEARRTVLAHRSLRSYAADITRHLEAAAATRDPRSRPTAASGLAGAH